MDNKGLKEKYEEMHREGPGAWFDDGAEERDGIIEIGKPWDGARVLEIGCGTGLLCRMMAIAGGIPEGVDYSEVAIEGARGKYPEIEFQVNEFRSIKGKWDRVVLQGVLEHLDKPFESLEWILDNLVEDRGDAIVSCPGFVNPRGIVWMTLNMMGAVMSKTDLHFINPWDVDAFCAGKYDLEMNSVDVGWGYAGKMVEDLGKRIPLACRDGRLKLDSEKLKYFLAWLEKCGHDIPAKTGNGAVVIYRIWKRYIG